MRHCGFEVERCKLLTRDEFLSQGNWGHTKHGAYSCALMIEHSQFPITFILESVAGNNYYAYSITTSNQSFLKQLQFQQFQVLFNSLFKVLCIFSSWYLYTIGFPWIIGFRWNLPPTWCCNPKQLDSLMNTQIVKVTGVSPSKLPYSKELHHTNSLYIFKPQLIA